MNKLLTKYINGKCTDKEKIEIINWIDSDPENMREYLRQRKLNDISNWRIKVPEALDPLKAKKNTIKSWFGNNLYKEAIKIAAVFIFAFFIFQNLATEISSRINGVNMQTLHVPAGQRAEITLEDGTKVWLNANTTLEFPSHFSGKKRLVSLNGEGFFEVKHDKSKPLIIEGGKYNVKVLGTKFNLVNYPEKEIFKTSLLDGSVEIMNKNGSSGFELKPNEEAHLENNTMIISPIQNVEHFLWREGIISINDLTFGELCEELELYFDVKIEMKNLRLQKSTFTGKFRMKDGIDHVLKVLQLKNGFQYRINEKLNIITIE